MGSIEQLEKDHNIKVMWSKDIDENNIEVMVEDLDPKHKGYHFRTFLVPDAPDSAIYKAAYIGLLLLQLNRDNLLDN